MCGVGVIFSNPKQASKLAMYAKTREYVTRTGKDEVVSVLPVTERHAVKAYWGVEV
jgi:hypothetical protein